MSQSSLLGREADVTAPHPVAPGVPARPRPSRRAPGTDPSSGRRRRPPGAAPRSGAPRRSGAHARKPRSNHRRRVRLLTGVIVVELLVAATLTGFVASPASLHRLRAATGGGPAAPLVSAAQPQPTTTPAAPGIALVPASNFDEPDPYLYEEGGTYYLYLSTAFNLLSENVPVLTGRPGHWSKPVDVMPTLPPWAEPNPKNGQLAGLVWEPEVYKFGSTYVMYSAPAVAGSKPVQHCITIAFATSPTGPFVPAARPFICQRDQGGDIDAQVYKDPTGPNGPGHPYYLTWKSDNNSTPGDGVPIIWAQALSNDGRQLVGQPRKIFTADEPWQQGLVEAPQLVRSPTGGTWLFYSGGAGFFTTNYGMGAAFCAGPFGPCVDQSPQPLVTTNAQGTAPGEETAFIAHDGSLWLLYNPFATGEYLNFFRPSEAVRIGMTPTSVYVAQAGTFPNPG